MPTNVPLSEGMRKLLDQAQHEARALNQEFVGTEHMMLAILQGSGTHATRILRSHHVDKDAVRSKLLSVLAFSENAPVVTGNLPLSPKAQKTLNTALVMSRSLREPKLSTRVMLLALMDEPKTALIDALRNTGVDVDELLRALAVAPDEPEA
jgi:ATP-dependent Clp protease ATP-binding subunit ClpC